MIAVRGVRGPWRGRDTLLAGATAATIAGYTVLDRYGVRHANLRVAGAGAIRVALGRNALLAGIGGIGSYVLVLAALRLASAAPVAAVRESSVVVAVALAALVLDERVGRARLAGGVAVAGGTILAAIG